MILGKRFHGKNTESINHKRNNVKLNCAKFLCSLEDTIQI